MKLLRDSTNKKTSRLDNYSKLSSLKADRKTWSKNKKGKGGINSKIKKIFGILIAIFFIFLIIGTIAGLAVIAHYSALVPNPNEILTVQQDEYSTFYDRNGKELYNVVGSENRIMINKLDEVPQSVRWAFIVAEDAEFYSHKGIDLVAIARCAVGNISNKQQCGGSTITQQVIKNAAFEKAIQAGSISKYERKIEEIITSLRAEQDFTKDQILLFYMNKINFGSNRYGLKTASKIYFGKDPKDLTLAESALLAGIPNSPSQFDPFGNVKDEYCRVNDGELFAESKITAQAGQDGLYKDSNGNDVIKAAPYKCRQLYVLKQYEKNLDKINQSGTTVTQSDIDNARKEELKFQPNRIDIKAPSFVFYARDQLYNADYNFTIDGKAITSSDIETGGYKIYTTLDLDMQDIAEQELKNWVDGTKDCKCDDAGIAKRFGVYNGAMASIDPKTGEILMMAGSKDWFGEKEQVVTADGPLKGTAKFDPKVNILISNQQTGSSNKPISYLAGIESGVLNPASFLPDMPVTFGNYTPQNAEGGNAGYAPGSSNNFLRNQLRQSLNRPAVMAADIMGVDSMLDMYEKLGYTEFKDRKSFGLSSILGATAVQPIEHFNAYATLANKGKYHKPQAILKIVDRAGVVKWEYKPDEGKQVVDERAAYIMSDILYNYGKEDIDLVKATGGYSVSGKTGTSDENKDMWFVGYTPDIVTGVWTGNNNNAAPHKQPYNNGGLPYGFSSAKPLWVRYSQKILTKYPKTTLTRPAGIVSADVCLISGKLATDKCGSTMKEIFIDGKLPPVDDSIQTIRVCTNIPAYKPEAQSLNMIARPIDETNGYAKDALVTYVKIGDPKKPTEQALFDKSSGQSIPTAQCTTDYNTISAVPTINIASPTDGAIIPSDNRTLSLNIQASPAVGIINSIIVTVGSNTVASTTDASLTQNLILDNSYGYGVKTLTVTAKDSSGRSSTKSISINLESPVSSQNLKITSPNSSNLTVGDSPAITAKWTGSGGLVAPSSVTLSISKAGIALPVYTESLSKLAGDTYTKPSYTFSSAGTYTITVFSGSLTDSKQITVAL
ncbi:MAG: transglycosylase domain-containing protein [bacterium]